MSVYTPVIRLPPKRQSMATTSLVRRSSSRVISHNRTTTDNEEEKEEALFEPEKDCLVSDTLYLNKLPTSIRETDIRTLLQHCMPIEIYIDRERDVGHLRFSHVKYADRAYSLYNGFTFTNNAKLELHMYQDKSLDPEATAMLLEVDGLPDYYDDNKLYDLFRPFGPLNLCKCVLKEGLFKGSAFIQFFDSSNSDKAEAHLNGHLLDERKLSVIPFMPSKAHASQQPQSQQQQLQKEEGYNKHFNSSSKHIPITDNDQESQHQQNNTSIDMLNLYIKNLEPHITNYELSQAFRKFGRIISARVMTNPATGQSKGYGFVSFGKSEEAAAALREMNGVMLGNRPITVAYHEPRKGRANNSNNNNNANGQINNSSTASASFRNQQNNNMNYGINNRNSTINNTRYQQQQGQYNTPPPFQPQESGYYGNKHQSQQAMQTNHHMPSLSVTAPLNGLGIDNVADSTMSSVNSNLKELSIGQRPSNLHHAVSNGSTTTSLPQKKISDTTSYSSPQQPLQQQHAYHTYNGSNKIRYSSSPISGAASTTGHSLASLASGLSIQRPPPSLVTPQQHPMATTYSSTSSSSLSPNHNSNSSGQNNRGLRPTLRRRGSIESVMTESSANIQRIKLEEAVRHCCSGRHFSNKQIKEIVDMLLTLKRKDRSICLFNPDFLQNKVQLAIDALATCHDSEEEDESDEEIGEQSTTTMSSRLTALTINKAATATTPTTTPFIPSPNANHSPQPPPVFYHTMPPATTYALLPPIKRESKAIPIVAPPSAETKAASSPTANSLTRENLVKNETIVANAAAASGEKKPSSTSTTTVDLKHMATATPPTTTTTTTTTTNTYLRTSHININASNNANNHSTKASSSTVMDRQDDGNNNTSSDAEKDKEIEALLSNIENKPVHEMKQLLGDKLFPLVKATGTKQAPKVTIYLLDTIDLQKLAHIMYDTPQLKQCVENAFQALQKQQ